MLSKKMKQSAKSLLEQLVRMLTPSEDIAAINALQDVIENRLHALGLQCRRFTDADYGDHIFATTETAGEKVLLMGHVDTVHGTSFTDGDWVERDASLYGPGVLDMKSGVVCILIALEVLYEQGILSKIPLAVLFNSDEEIGSPGTRKILPEVLQGVSAGLVFEGGRLENQIVVGRNGIRAYRLSIKGKAAHAGNQHAEGRNAIWAAAILTQSIESYTDYSSGQTLNVGRLYGGSCINVVPEIANLEFEIRAPTEEQLDSLEERVRADAQRIEEKGFRIHIEADHGIAAMPIAEKHRALAHSYGESARACGLTMKPMTTIERGGSNANDISSAGIACIDGLGPLGKGAHTRDEWIDEESFYKRIEILIHWLSQQERR